MEKKLVLFDLDETFLNTDKTICRRNLDDLDRLLCAGHYAAIATGRSVSGGRMMAEKANMLRPGCFMLCFHGSLLYDLAEDRVIFSKGISQDIGMDLMRALCDAGIYAQTYDQKQMFIPREGEELLLYNRVTHEKYQVFSDPAELSEVPMYKIIAIDYHDHEKLARFQKAYAPKEAGVLNSFFSCPEFLEYCGYGLNKGSGLLKLAKYLCVRPENTIAIGDERNDLSMIEAAGIGCAMKNGREEAKQVADYITESDNNHGGVGEVIEKFILNTHEQRN